MLLKKVFSTFKKEEISTLNFICGLIVFVATFYYTLGMPLDYGAHLQLAQKFSFADILHSLSQNSYPLWHLVCIGFERIFNIPGKYASALSSSIFVYFTYLITSKIILCAADNGFEKRCVSIFSAMLMFVQPIYIPWFNHSQITGQGSPNILYNPTNLATKPFAILCVWLFLKICIKYSNCENEFCKNNFDFIQLAIVQFISVFAKPSFAQVCLPAVAVYLVYLLIKTKGNSLIFSIKIVISWVPAFVWICLTFYLNFISVSSSNGNGIALSFFDVWKIYSPCIPISILLAICFPLIVFLISYKFSNNIHKFGLYFGAIMVFVGICEYGLLMETGDRMLHGNFSWGYNISLAIFWTFATSLLVSHFKDDHCKSKKWVIVFLVFIIHFVFGIYYYFNTINF